MVKINKLFNNLGKIIFKDDFAVIKNDYTKKCTKKLLLRKAAEEREVSSTTAAEEEEIGKKEDDEVEEEQCDSIEAQCNTNSDAIEESEEETKNHKRRHSGQKRKRKNIQQKKKKQKKRQERNQNNVSTTAIARIEYLSTSYYEEFINQKTKLREVMDNPNIKRFLPANISSAFDPINIEPELSTPEVILIKLNTTDVGHFDVNTYKSKSLY